MMSSQMEVPLSDCTDIMLHPNPVEEPKKIVKPEPKVVEVDYDETANNTPFPDKKEPKKKFEDKTKNIKEKTLDDIPEVPDVPVEPAMGGSRIVEYADKLCEDIDTDIKQRENPPFTDDNDENRIIKKSINLFENKRIKTYTKRVLVTIRGLIVHEEFLATDFCNGKFEDKGKEILELVKNDDRDEEVTDDAIIKLEELKMPLMSNLSQHITYDQKELIESSIPNPSDVVEA